LAKLDHIFVQDALSEDVLKSEGIFTVTRAGDTRIDRVVEVSQADFDHPICKAIKEEENILLVGSSWPEDEQLLFEAMKYDEWPSFDRIIIVPHELSDMHLKRLVEKAPEPATIIKQEMPDPKARIIIVNEMGVLAKLYRLADIAYIGGGFGEGIHSILEAAVYGIPVVFGPKHHKFKEAEDLIRLGAAAAVSRAEDLQKAATHFADTPTQIKVRQILSEYFESQSGASRTIGNYIIERLNKA
jgi:3-deoxy-D-manno-octulosonic-acid transferase